MAPFLDSAAIIPAESLPTMFMLRLLLDRLKSTAYFSERALYSVSFISRPVSSQVTSTCTACESSWSHARS